MLRNLHDVEFIALLGLEIELDLLLVRIRVVIDEVISRLFSSVIGILILITSFFFLLKLHERKAFTELLGSFFLLDHFTCSFDVTRENF